MARQAEGGRWPTPPSSGRPPSAWRTPPPSDHSFFECTARAIPLLRCDVAGALSSQTTLG
eukprot:7060075-Alexandrium_andersonii.AAC.1